MNVETILSSSFCEQLDLQICDEIKTFLLYKNCQMPSYYRLKTDAFVVSRQIREVESLG